MALLIAVCGTAPSAFAEEEKAPAGVPKRTVYKQAGAPADPKVSARWNLNHDYEQSTQLLQDLAKTFPKLCKLQSLGHSFQGREMWLLTIAKQDDKTPETQKPAFWIDGGIHANEIQCTDVVLYTAWFLLESNDRNPTITRMIDERVFYLVPMMSPDSRHDHMYGANSHDTPRTMQYPIDDDGDGLIDEDGPDDLDGDGNITEMRYKDPNGRWKPHPEFPEELVPCKPGERGSYTLLETEGFDNDGDGLIDEDDVGYVDPNRNWAWLWQPEYVMKGAHRYPFSLEETRVVAEFVMAHPNIAGCQSYHNPGGMILHGPGSKSEKQDADDIAVIEEIAKTGEKILPGYRSMDTGPDLYEVYGGETEWFYDMQGVVAFTNELFTPYDLFRRVSPGEYGSVEDWRNFDKWLLLSDGYVKWHEVDHPQFGKIEVGGFKKNWYRQPPSFMLEEECHRNMAFTLYHADQMPQVEVQTVEVKPLSMNLRQVTAVVANPKIIPTRLNVNIQNKITGPDIVELSGPNVKVLVGLTSDTLVFEKTKEQPRQPAKLKFDTIKGMQAVYARWIVTGPGPYTVTARSAKGGVASKTAE
jgi:hypothetical protein